MGVQKHLKKQQYQRYQDEKFKKEVLDTLREDNWNIEHNDSYLLATKKKWKIIHYYITGAYVAFYDGTRRVACDNIQDALKEIEQLKNHGNN